MKPRSLLLLLPLVFLPSCASDPDVRRGQATGAVVGGAAVGLMSDSWGGAAVGAAVGGLVGGEVAKNR
ncbi:hypothetical protein [Haloferula sp. BvORR071]|uniref:hypothetical protein n=1 Tax=Haloferula sp. BvORR071 TaxID=1396141 RepID=UPI00054F8AF1|nr:hypothetical protein [Haloferula sp. BvORR071]